MPFAKQKSAGKIASTLVIALLLAVAAGLYLQIIMVDRPMTQPEQPIPAASIRVLEADSSGSAASSRQPLPGDQMDLILRVFAPESTSE
jgi:hypothetical protein